MKNINRVKTPCIGVCSTGIGDTVCRGCKRFAHEIIQWNAYSEEQKRLVLQRLNQLLSQVVQARLAIVDEQQLLAQCQLQKVKINPDADPLCWVFDLLKAGASQIQAMEPYGCRINSEYIHLSPVQIKDDIDKDFFILSEVHYERYFDAKHRSFVE
ncbi:hypothetical protein TDB9533_01138 [Thalassocella blandensis]|nr:hypothetical protein TDB9533_01138 [Thalassocella blandensis]